jgi:tRNA-Thr(GGU) m(6)t(6)A37 methyltransferase TsaA
MSKLPLFVVGASCASLAMLVSVAARAADPAGQASPARGLAPQAAAPASAGETAQPETKLSLVSLGVVKRNGNRTFLVLDKKYAPGLVSVGDFSHTMVFYWCDRNDTPDKRAFLQGYRQGKANPLTGVFATRSPARPNPIAITTCKIVQVKDNIVEIEWIDAFDDSPIIDLKPYIPRNDSIPTAQIPVWVR